MTNFIDKGKKRDSSTELLRIICMIMILCLHSFDASRLVPGDAILLDLGRESFCICCVNVFVLISGFYSIHWKAKSFSSFIFQVYFYSVILFLLCWALGLTEFKNIYRFGSRIIFPILNWWFVASYLLLYLISPLLNKISDDLQIWGNILLIGVIYAISLALDFKMILLFSVLYLVGRLLHKKMELFRNLDGFRYCVVYVVLSVIVTALAYHYYNLGLNDNLSLTHNLFAESYYNPFVIIQSVALFLFVTSFRYFNKYINKIAVSSFAIYLFHMHPDLKNYYFNFTSVLYEHDLFIHIFVLVLLFILVCFVSILFDQLRIKSFEYLYSRVAFFLKQDDEQ